MVTSHMHRIAYNTGTTHQRRHPHVHSMQSPSRLLLLISSSYERSDVVVAPALGPTRRTSAESMLVKARDGRARATATLHPMLPQCWPARPPTSSPGQSARASTGACAPRASQVEGLAVGGRARRSRSRDMVVDLPGSSRARHSGAVRVCAHEVSEVRGQMAWAHSFSRWRCR